MSEETVCEHLSPALQTNAKEPLMADKAEMTVQDNDKKSLELPTADGLSSRSDCSPSENSENPNSSASGEELPKVTTEPTEVLNSEHNGDKFIEGNGSSPAIKMQMEDEKRLHLKALFARSQYHSIQQLSSPSTKWNKSVNCAPRISYKISDIVNPSRFYDENGKRSFSSSTCENMEIATQSSEDEDEAQRRARYSGKMPHNAQVMDYGWSACEARKPVYQANPCEFSDEEEEFLQSSFRCGSESLEDMSDMEMSDGGSRSHEGSVGEVQQREALANVEESSQGLDVVDEFVLADTGLEGKMEAKRARVENIIKTMTPLHKGILHSFPVCQSFSAVSKLSENRDKEFSLNSVHDQASELRRPKRKQYIPQQVDPRGEQHDFPPAAKVCVMERDAVGNELLKMQEGLSEMQQKYKQKLDCEHEVSFSFSDNDDSKDNSGDRLEKAHGLSDVNQNDVKSVSREFRHEFSNGDEWMLDVANENAKDLGLNGSVNSLEQLTKILKTQITSGVERLVDNFLKTFLRKCFHSTLRDGAKNVETMSPKGAVPISSRKEDFVRPDLKLKDELKKIDGHMKDEGIGQQQRGDSSGTGSKVKDDLSRSENHVQDDFLIATSETRDNSSFAERKRKATPLTFTALSYHAASRSGADVSSHLPTLPPPLTMQPFPIHNSISDGRRPSFSCERDKTVEKYREHYFDTHNGGAFGIPQSHLSLFGPHHPHLYYSPCIGKFPPAFVKEQEQMEPLPLIVGAPKKPKRTKVIDRVSPRAIRSVPQETATQSDDGSRQLQDSPGKSFHPTPRYHPAGPVHDAFPHPSLLPFGLAPSVALHNSSLQQHSTLLQAMYSQMPSISHREKPSCLSSPTRKTPPYSSSSDLSSAPKSFQKCESDASMYDQMMSDSMLTVGSSHSFTSTLTPMHLRKAKLMFFYVRYPSSAILKVYFPDVKFNKNNTAQLVKWFSNFREFYYIQMEKYARQALAEGVKSAKDLVVTTDAELYRILVVHYNRNCQIEVPENFRYVVQATLREFYTSVVAEKDQEPSWKKSIYKVIARMDDPVPDYFKSPNWMERLADG